MPTKTIQNKFVSLSVDARGRLVSLKNKGTGTELIAHRDAAEGWRLVVPSGRHTIDLVYGSRQAPPAITVTKSAAGARLVIAYDRLVAGREVVPVAARFTWEIDVSAPVIRAWAEIDNRGGRSIDEVEFPVVGGLGGFRSASRDREIQLVEFDKRLRSGWFRGEILNQPLPVTGEESDQYVREHETAMWEDQRCGQSGFDFHGATEGLYFGYNTPAPQDFVLKVERYPKGAPHGTAHWYPQGTPRWLRLWGVHLPQLAPGASWKSEPVTLYAHAGGWHAAADWYAGHCVPALQYARPPAWMDDFVGWTEITGKLYTGEVFHDFATCAEQVMADHAVTGLDLLFYYGHTHLGAEGADLDQSPATDLGGEQGFAAMLAKLHARGIRVMVLDHLHRYINRDLPEFRARNLERLAVLDASGRPVESRWWKETVLSCRRFAGPTPVWVEMCPACPEWQEIYRDHVRRTIARGVDGLELDCFVTSVCHSRDHGHPPGTDMLPAKIEFMRAVRVEAKRLNPDFVFIFEIMDPRTREVADGWYPFRYPDEHGRIHRFLFPELWQQAVRVGNYGYDAVNKALMLGLGVETEIWGLRKTTLAGCPELARYIGQVTALRRRYAGVLIRGTFRDTLGATVKPVSGQAVLYGVIDGGAAGKALVLRNPTPKRVRTTARLEHVRGQRLVLARPGRRDQLIRRQPVTVTLGPYGAAVLLAK